jgi:hypothetical protein
MQNRLFAQMVGVEARKALEGSPAFHVHCSAKTDCEFGPSISQNASAIAEDAILVSQVH